MKTLVKGDVMKTEEKKRTIGVIGKKRQSEPKKPSNLKHSY